MPDGPDDGGPFLSRPLDENCREDNEPEVKPNAKAEKFDARTYFFDTVRWFSAWPNCAIEKFEEAGFTRIRLERVEPHPVYHLRMRAPAKNLPIKEAGRLIRKVVEQAGTVPRDGYFCFSPRKGVVEANFVLDL